MKELKLFGLMFLIVSVIAGLGEMARAQNHDLVVANHRGTFPLVGVVTGSSVAGTAFSNFSDLTGVGPENKLIDGAYFNNTPSVVWIGTISATLHDQTHTNIIQGFPVLSSSTFNLDGKFSGIAGLFFTCDVGDSTCEMRPLEGANR